MKPIQKSLLLIALFATSFAIKAQTADDIINKYLTQVGGADKMRAVKTFITTGKVKVQGMELPITMIQKAPNLQKATAVFQGKEMVQPCFDGAVCWNTNMMTMKAEKSDAETSFNMIQDSEMLDPFVDYAKRGFAVALEGSETVEGTDCHKIKLTKKPVKVDGKEEENITFYFFDKDNNVPIMTRSINKTGPAKGATVETVMSNYQEVKGMFLPFEMTIKYNGQVGQTVIIEKVEVDVPVDSKVFAFPE
jgi:hypothetical protein